MELGRTGEKGKEKYRSEKKGGGRRGRGDGEGKKEGKKEGEEEGGGGRGRRIEREECNDKTESSVILNVSLTQLPYHVATRVPVTLL